QPNTSTATATFDPITGGTTTIKLDTPAGFDTPVNANTQIVATVTAPAINLSGGANVGEDMQVTGSGSLGVAPPSPVDITLTIASGSIARISDSPTKLGSTSVSFLGVTNASSRTYYVQGLKTGSTQLTASAPGYADSTLTVTVDPSGFIIYT